MRICIWFDLLTLLVSRFLLKYDKLAHVKMKESILCMNHHSSGVRSKESHRISRMRRCSGFSSVSGRSSDSSVDCGCDRVFASTVVISLLGDIMVVAVWERFLQDTSTPGSGVRGQRIYRAIHTCNKQWPRSEIVAYLSFRHRHILEITPRLLHKRARLLSPSTSEDGRVCAQSHRIHYNSKVGCYTSFRSN